MINEPILPPDRGKTDSTQKETVDAATLVESLRKIEEALGLPVGSLTDLPREESDWVFVIRAQAIVEAALTHLLVSHITVEKTRPLIKQLPLRGRIGKLELAQKWDLLEPMNVDFVAGLGVLRNALAHDPAYVGFSFWDYVHSLNDRDLKVFRKWSHWTSKFPLEDRRKFTTTLKFQMFAHVAIIVTRAHKEVSAAESRRQRNELYADLAQWMLDEGDGGDGHESDEFAPSTA